MMLKTYVAVCFCILLANESSRALQFVAPSTSSSWFARGGKKLGANFSSAQVKLSPAASQTNATEDDAPAIRDLAKSIAKLLDESAELREALDGVANSSSATSSTRKPSNAMKFGQLVGKVFRRLGNSFLLAMVIVHHNEITNPFFNRNKIINRNDV